MRTVFIAILLLAQAVVARTHFVLISAPGSGKGTFSQYLVRKYGYVQICPGDIFRDHIRTKTPLGCRIKPIVERGDYVDEETVFELMAERLTNALDAGSSVILDGFPRSEHSFDFLDQYFRAHAGTDTLVFIQFVASDDVCIDRITNRLICPHCAAVFSTQTFANSGEKVCAHCSNLLTTRSADTAEIARSRILYFHETIEPLMDRAAERYPVCKISTECTYEELEKIYDALME